MGLEYCKPDTSGAYEPWEVVDPQLKKLEDKVMSRGTLRQNVELAAVICNVNACIERMKNA